MSLKVTYKDYGYDREEIFNESDINTNLARAVQYAKALREVGGNYITNVRVVVDV